MLCGKIQGRPAKQTTWQPSEGGSVEVVTGHSFPAPLLRLIQVLAAPPTVSHRRSGRRQPLSEWSLWRVPQAPGHCWPGPCRFLELPAGAQKQQSTQRSIWLEAGYCRLSIYSSNKIDRSAVRGPQWCPKLNCAGKGTQNQGHRPLFTPQGPRRRAATSACPRNAAPLRNKREKGSVSTETRKSKAKGRERSSLTSSYSSSGTVNDASCLISLKCSHHKDLKNNREKSMKQKLVLGKDEQN